MAFQSWILIFYSSNGVIREGYVKEKVISFTLDGNIYFNVGFMQAQHLPFPS